MKSSINQVPNATVGIDDRLTAVFLMTSTYTTCAISLSIAISWSMVINGMGTLAIEKVASSTIKLD